MINPKIKALVSNQVGAVSIYISFSVMFILALISLSFAQIVNIGHSETVENQLNQQARYAAETGINDLRPYVNQLREDLYLSAYTGRTISGLTSSNAPPPFVVPNSFSYATDATYLTNGVVQTIPETLSQKIASSANPNVALLTLTNKTQRIEYQYLPISGTNEDYGKFIFEHCKTYGQLVRPTTTTAIPSSATTSWSTYKSQPSVGFDCLYPTHILAIGMPNKGSQGGLKIYTYNWADREWQAKNNCTADQDANPSNHRLQNCKVLKADGVEEQFGRAVSLYKDSSNKVYLGVASISDAPSNKYSRLYIYKLDTSNLTTQSWSWDLELYTSDTQLRKIQSLDLITDARPLSGKTLNSDKLAFLTTHDVAYMTAPPSSPASLTHCGTTKIDPDGNPSTHDSQWKFIDNIDHDGNPTTPLYWGYECSHPSVEKSFPFTSIGSYHPLINGGVHTNQIRCRALSSLSDAAAFKPIYNPADTHRIGWRCTIKELQSGDLATYSRLHGSNQLHQYTVYPAGGFDHGDDSRPPVFAATDEINATFIDNNPREIVVGLNSNPNCSNCVTPRALIKRDHSGGRIEYDAPRTPDTSILLHIRRNDFQGFGSSVASYGDDVIIGAKLSDKEEDGTTLSGKATGAVYRYEHSSSHGLINEDVDIDNLRNNNIVQNGDRFGQSVALTSGVLAVGSKDAVHVFGPVDTPIAPVDPNSINVPTIDVQYQWNYLTEVATVWAQGKVPADSPRHLNQATWGYYVAVNTPPSDCNPDDYSGISNSDYIRIDARSVTAPSPIVGVTPPLPNADVGVPSSESVRMRFPKSARSNTIYVCFTIEDQETPANDYYSKPIRVDSNTGQSTYRALLSGGGVDCLKKSDPRFNNLANQFRWDFWQDPQADGDVGYTCLDLELNPDDIRYDGVSHDHSFNALLKTQSRMGKLKIKWRKQDLGDPPYNYIPSAAFQYPQLPRYNDWNLDATILQVQITALDSSGFSRQSLAQNTKIFYLYPSDNYSQPGDTATLASKGNPRATKSRSNFANIKPGDIIHGRCNAKGNCQHILKFPKVIAAIRDTDPQIDPGDNTQYLINITSFYGKADITLKGYRGIHFNNPLNITDDLNQDKKIWQDTEDSLPFLDVQAVLRATGRAEGIKVRLEERISLLPPVPLPESGIHTATSICKLLISDPDYGTILEHPTADLDDVQHETGRVLRYGPDTAEIDANCRVYH